MVERGAADGGAPRFPHGHFMLPTAAGNDRNSRSEELRNNAGGYWEIFSKNSNWVDRLSQQYKKTELLHSNFQEFD